MNLVGVGAVSNDFGGPPRSAFVRRDDYAGNQIE